MVLRTARMLLLNVLAAAAATLCLIATGLPAQRVNRTSAVTLSVADPTGAAIPQAQIALFPSPVTVPKAMKTGNDGRLAVDVEPGNYALFIRSPGFALVAQRIEIQDTATQSLSFVLKVVGCSGCVVIEADARYEDLLEIWYNNCCPRKVHAEELKIIPHRSIVVHSSGNNTDGTYSGVPLTNFLAKSNERNDLHAETFVITEDINRDMIVFPVTDSAATPSDRDIFIADTLNGKPISNGTNNKVRLFLIQEGQAPQPLQSFPYIEVRSLQ